VCCFLGSGGELVFGAGAEVLDVWLCGRGASVRAGAEGRRAQGARARKQNLTANTGRNTTQTQQRETSTHPSRVQVERLPPLVRVEDFGKVALREEDAALKKGVRGHAREALAPGDQLGRQRGAAELGDQLVVVDLAVGAAGDVPGGDDLSACEFGLGLSKKEGRVSETKKEKITRERARGALDEDAVGSAAAAAAGERRRTCSWLFWCPSCAGSACGAGTAAASAICPAGACCGSLFRSLLFAGARDGRNSERDGCARPIVRWVDLCVIAGLWVVVYRVLGCWCFEGD